MLSFEAIDLLLKEKDYTNFQQKSLALLQNESSDNGSPNSIKAWELFCQQLNKMPDPKPEKMMLMQATFKCLEAYPHRLESGELAQFLTLAKHLKAVNGLQLLRLLCTAKPHRSRLLSSGSAYSAQANLQRYLTIFQLLIDLLEEPTLLDAILEKVQKHLSFFALIERDLLALQSSYLASKYPERDLDTVLASFGQKTDKLLFPLSSDELERIKPVFLDIQKAAVTYRSLPQDRLEAELKKSAKSKSKPDAIAILAETIRRTYHIYPYDTQIIALLGLLQFPRKLKGRLAQIKTGEGKSTIIAMLAGFIASRGLCVDIITSSSYLAIRDNQKYDPFFKALGLASSHICHEVRKPEHFQAPILYGMNTDFEFALLYDGFFNTKLRHKRPYEAVIVDEVDNLILDTALMLAQIAIQDTNSSRWAYEAIFNFAKTNPEKNITAELIEALRNFIKNHTPTKHHDSLAKLKDHHLSRWLESAWHALYHKEKGRDYRLEEIEGIVRVTPVDFNNTGRTQRGMRWQNGIHEFVELKEGLPMRKPQKTAASIAHPAFFGLYKYILGLTGTMGDASERHEVESIYKIDTFDVPPHFPSLRVQEKTIVVTDVNAQWAEFVAAIQTNKRPTLILFKTIGQSDNFSKHLKRLNIKHQLLNDEQREAEDYLVAQAGEIAMVTIATNTAGRGTDIKISPASKTAGGLKMLFGFYPDNVRVEDQGFGRAGRQNTPGSCGIILHHQDDAIKNLAQSTGIDLQSIDTDTLMDLLSKRRTEQTQVDSLRRLWGSQQEIVYFEQLQSFFTKMAVIYDLMEDKNFEAALALYCSRPSVAINEPSMLNESYWEPLIESASTCTDQWTPFVIQFKEIYLTHLRSLWADYYSKLRDPLEADQRSAAYQAIDYYLNDPVEKIKRILFLVIARAPVVTLHRQSNTLPSWGNYQNDVKVEYSGPTRRSELEGPTRRSELRRAGTETGIRRAGTETGPY